MRHTIFESRHRAEELMEEAIHIWRQSDRSEQLEGLEKDPVFGLLMSAIAYQANEVDNEIERLKTDVLEEYAQMLVPYEMGHAIPATAVVETMSTSENNGIEISEDCIFQLNGSSFNFTPVFRTRVMDATVESVKRLDGRRWTVKLKFSSPINDLSLMTFSIDNAMYRDIRVTIDDKELPLIRPWEYSELPLNDAYTLESAIYNKALTYDPSTTCLDLFARHDMNMYCVRRHKGTDLLPHETQTVKMIFEFTGVNASFHFDQHQLHLNTLLLANATRQDVTLDRNNPIARIGSMPGTGQSLQFMHVIRPIQEQIYAHTPLKIRRVMGDRFNQASLLKLLSSLLNKLQSDFYAFQYLKSKESQHTMDVMREQLQKLISLTTSTLDTNIEGTYLMIKPNTNDSLHVSCMVTNGAAVNPLLNDHCRFVCPPILSESQTRVICPPIPGTNQLTPEDDASETVRYAIATNDRIVTPADIRIFCYSELNRRYGIMRDMVTNFSVKQQPASADTRSHNACGYEIAVNITLGNSAYVKRSFADKAGKTEVMLEKMMQVRSANIYPIRVHFTIEE